MLPNSWCQILFCLEWFKQEYITERTTEKRQMNYILLCFFSFGFVIFQTCTVVCMTHAKAFAVWILIFIKVSSLKCIQNVLSFIYNPNKLIKAKTDRKIERIKSTGPVWKHLLSMSQSRRNGIQCLSYLSSNLLNYQTKYNDQKHYSVYGLVNQSGYGSESILIDENGCSIAKNKPKINEASDAMIIFRNIL